MASFPEGCALVFGGSGGIGSGVARTFAEAGSDIAVVWRSRSEPAEAAASHARGLGRKASTHQADVTRPDEVRAAINAAIGLHGRIHSVIWGAGPLVNQHYLAETPIDEWRHAFEVEVHGFFAAMALIVPHMRAMGGGSFVHLGSAGHDWWPARDGLSVAVKAANEQVIRGLAKEEGKHGIRANSVLVGVIDAGMFRDLMAQGAFPDEWIEETRKMLAIKRWGQPEEIGYAVSWLASSRAAYVTGQQLNVSGGFGI